MTQSNFLKGAGVNGVLVAYSQMEGAIALCPYLRFTFHQAIATHGVMAKSPTKAGPPMPPK